MNLESDPPKKPLVLIVDDTRTNIIVLTNALKNNYELSVARNGVECLDAVNENPPDLILLDIMMPEMGGYEACEILKSRKKTSSIPVIFLTAKSLSEDEEKGLELGAVDYITKPICIPTLLLRIQTQLELKAHREKLEQMVKDRTEQLIHADRLATLGTFSAGIAHEINNPNTFVKANVQVLQKFWKYAHPILCEHSDDDESGKVTLLRDEINEILESIINGSDRIHSIVNSLKLYSRQDQHTRKKVQSIKNPIDDALKLLKTRLSGKVSIYNNVSPDIEVPCDSQKICQIFVNLINNAYDALPPEGGSITLESREFNNRAIITVRDTGAGISVKHITHIFDPFFTTKEKGVGTGLGLPIVSGIVDEHSATIKVTKTSEEGTEFTLSFPIEE